MNTTAKIGIAILLVGVSLFLVQEVALYYCSHSSVSCVSPNSTRLLIDYPLMAVGSITTLVSLVLRR